MKDVFNEQWDDYQLEAVSTGFGGNKLFFNLLREYNIQALPILEKYQHKAAKYYARKLTAMIDRSIDFKELPPAKDWNERIVRAQTTV